MSGIISRLLWKMISIKFQQAMKTGKFYWGISGKIFPLRLPKPLICASPKCWRKSTNFWNHTCFRPRRTIQPRAFVKTVVMANYPCGPHALAVHLLAVPTIPNAVIPARWLARLRAAISLALMAKFWAQTRKA